MTWKLKKSIDSNLIFIESNPSFFMMMTIRRRRRRRLVLVLFLPLLVDPSSVTFALITPSPRIVGGTVANAIRFPYYTALFRVINDGVRKFTCGGSLIRNNVVVTAGKLQVQCTMCSTTILYTFT